MEDSLEEYTLLVVRFTNGTPDLTLAVPSPSTSTVLHLKAAIRRTLSGSPTSKRKLRLIFAGKALNDDDSISAALKIRPQKQEVVLTDKARGKRPLRRTSIHTPPAAVVYIDVATKGREATAAASRAPSPAPTAHHTQTTSTTPAPRGFDRLLGQGLSAQEVVELRAQFNDIQSHSHTPDTMPSASEMRALEDAWLDSGSALGGGGGLGELGQPAGAGAYEDILWGTIAGFFWPLGAALWLGSREEGAWSRRRQIAVWTGFGVNLLMGFFRLTS